MSISLVNDSGKSGDNLTNDARMKMSFDPTKGAVTYTLKSVVKDVQKLLGKANTPFKIKLDNDGNFILPEANKTGAYILEMKQGAVTESIAFAVDKTLPGALKAEINNDTGKTGDKITNDATLKLTGLEADTTVEWRDSSTGEWKAVATELLSASGKFTLLNANDLLGEDFKGTLEFRQVDAAGNAQKAVSKVALTYDTTAPEVLDVVAPTVDSIANGKTSIVRILSSEALVGLDKSDFMVSIPTLASVTGVKEVKLKDGSFAYDVTLTASKAGGGDVSLSFAETATVTDVAGNNATLDTEKLASFWVGNGNLQVSLVEDTGKVGDNVTHNGDIKLAAIRDGFTVAFKINAGSESIAAGTNWITIDEASDTINVEDLYALAGVSLDEASLDGWKDTLEFRQFNAETEKTSGATALTFTYDNYVDSFTRVLTETDEVSPGGSVVLNYESDEKLVGFGTDDLMVIDAALASITGMKEAFVKDGGYWNYSVTVKASAAAAIDSEITIAFTDDASITDVAGNVLDLTAVDPYSLFII